MQITRQADYAVRAIIYLARLGAGRRAATAQIAHDQAIPATFLAKIVSQLAAAGLVHSMRGAHGGVSLARPAESISLLEVVETIDGPIALNECVTDPGCCGLSAECQVRNVWVEAQAKLVKHLAQVDLARMARPAPAAEVIEASALLPTKEA